ncbi:hypothetical protein VHUM_01106 [Vanrija humicola]|uniref:Ion transport domain-containing protein n=1 Tax=Vanrija humicola TaxID=5417 RepID=A0A7D8V4C2_VANHU|nr:hypothetical protein VHUM_01106 [Vanrija humicola]
MATYPPPRTSLSAEEYELTAAGTVPPPPAPAPGSAKSRKLTLHPNASTSSSPVTQRPRPRRRASSNSTRLHSGGDHQFTRSHFLNEDLDHLGPASEEVHVPNFGSLLGFNETGEDHYAVASTIRSRWKRKLYLLLEEPASGREAFYVHVLVTGAIIFSAILTTLSTLPAFHTDPVAVKTQFGLDTTLVLLFTVEYIARSLAHSASWSMYYNWATSFFGITDLLAILPYYIEVIRQQDTSILFRFSILRTFRLLRVFRAFRYQSSMLLTIEVMYVAVRRSKDALIAISYFILLVLVLFSTLIYFAERGTWDVTLGAFVDSDGDVSLFDSIPQTAWYALVTMSTAGYGDVVPKSALGKLLSVPLLMFGLLLIALPSFVLGRNFAIVYDAMVHTIPPAPTPADSPPPSPPRRAGVLTPVEEADSVPLLPVTAPAQTPTLGPSPPPHVKEGSGGSLSQPKMWDPLAQGLPASSSTAPQAPRDKELSNVKLAKNQFVLLEQIDSLRRVVDKQGETIDRQAQMMAQLLEALSIKEGLSESPSRKDKGKGKAQEDDDDEHDSAII